MPERVSIFVEGAPLAFGHYSQVIKFGNQLFISGQLPLDLKTNKVVSDDITEQSEAVMNYMTAIMQACQGALSNIMITTVYLTDLKDHDAFDAASKDYFFFTPPARTLVQAAGLPFGAKIMMDAVADLNPPEYKPGVML